MLRIALAALLLTGCGLKPGLPPIAGAARDGRTDLIATLIKQGADPNVRSGVNSWTPLLHAIHKHQNGSVIALLEGGADVNAASPDGTTPLMMAAGYGYTDTVEILLDRGADARARLKNGMNALAMAVMGTSDIDRFTMGACQVPTAMALARRVPGLKLDGIGNLPREILAVKLKGCVALEYLRGNGKP